MDGAFPFFVVWLVTWGGLMVYLLRLDLQIRQLERASQSLKDREREEFVRSGEDQ